MNSKAYVADQPYTGNAIPRSSNRYGTADHREHLEDSYRNRYSSARREDGHSHRAQPNRNYSHYNREREFSSRPSRYQERQKLSANTQWRPRTVSNTPDDMDTAHMRNASRNYEASSSPLIHNPLARGVPLRSDLQEDTQVAMDKALGEVIEVMVQYTKCADPTESAARQERLRIAEEQGELEATAIMMVQASINALPPPPPSS